MHESQGLIPSTTKKEGREGVTEEGRKGRKMDSYLDRFQF
jgi:hypothetical protein